MRHHVVQQESLQKCIIADSWCMLDRQARLDSTLQSCLGITAESLHICVKVKIAQTLASLSEY